MKPGEKIPKCDHEKIVNLYLSGEPTKKIAIKFNICSQTIYNILEKQNIYRKGNKYRLHKFNINYFENIDSADKAYFLGLLYADGYNSESSIEIALKEEDKYILEIFANFVNYTGSLEFLKKQSENHENKYRLRLNSVKMCKDLTNLGCIKAKSHKTYFPDISEEFHSHFVRGYFDGDGSIYINKKHKNINTMRVTFTGNNKLILKIQEILIKNCNLSETKIYYVNKKVNNICDLSYGGNRSVTKIRNYMYKNCDFLYVERKKMLMDSIGNRVFEQKFCKICNEKQKCKGLCKFHYQQYQNSKFYKNRLIENFIKNKIENE